MPSLRINRSVKPFRWCFVGLAALVVVGGCSSSHRGAVAPTTSTTGSIPPISPSVPVTSTTSTTAAAAVPTLGVQWGGPGQKGYGTVRPPTIFNGGDPTGMVTDVAWQSWGDPEATASGISEFVAPNQSVSDGTEEAATVVAFHLATCQGKAAYDAIEWYFPQHGQSFNPNQYINMCTGAYVTGSSMCTTAQLTITVAAMQSGMSHFGYVLLFKNNGQLCQLDGYPGLDGVSAAGVTVHAQRTLSGYLGGLGAGVAEPTVTLNTGQTASATFEGEAPASPTPGLCTFATLVVTPPNETQSVRLTAPSAQLCQLQIHPVVPGVTGDDGM